METWRRDGHQSVLGIDGTPCEGKLSCTVWSDGKGDSLPSYINQFPVLISSVRKRKINISIIIQGITQLWRLYTKELADSIVTCCDTILFLGCNDESSASFVSARSGIASVIVKSTREQKGVGLRFSKALLGYQENAGVGRREVLTPSEARTLGPNECIIIINGLNIMKAYKYPYTLHPLARNGLKSVRLSDFTPATQKYALREDLDAFVMQDLENHWKLQRAKKGKPAPASETEPLPFNTVPKKRKGSRTNSKHDENQLGMFDLNDVGQTTQAEPIPSEPMDMALDGMTLLEVNLPEGYEM